MAPRARPRKSSKALPSPSPPAPVASTPDKKIRALTIGGGPSRSSKAVATVTRSAQRHQGWRGRAGNQDLVMPPLSKQDLANLLLDSTDFAVCCFQIAADVAGLGYTLVETKEGQTVPKHQVKRDREILETFFDEAPGGEEGDETLQQINTQALVDQEATGDGYIEVTRDEDTDLPNGLYHLQSTRTLIRKDRQGFAQAGQGGRDVVWFRMFGSDPDTGFIEKEEWAGLRDLTPEQREEIGRLHEVMHLKHYHPSSFWYGIPRIVPALAAVRGSLFAAERNIRFFFNKSLPEYALIVETGTETIPDEDMQGFLDNIADHFLTEMQGEHFKPLMIQLPSGITIRFEKMSAEVKDSDHNIYRRDNRDEVLRAHSMQPNRVGVIETANLGSGTGESQIEIYKNGVTKPRQEILEKKYNRLIRHGFKIRTLAFKLNEIDSIDEQHEAVILQILSLSGLVTINEGRKIANERLKQALPEIDEDWADLPLPILQPQLSIIPVGIDEINPPLSEDEANPAHAGHPVATALGGKTHSRILDDAYRRFSTRRRVGTDPGRNGATGTGSESIPRPAKGHQPR